MPEEDLLYIFDYKRTNDEYYAFCKKLIKK